MVIFKETTSIFSQLLVEREDKHFLSMQIQHEYCMQHVHYYEHSVLIGSGPGSA